MLPRSGESGNMNETGRSGNQSVAPQIMCAHSRLRNSRWPEKESWEILIKILFSRYLGESSVIHAF